MRYTISPLTPDTGAEVRGIDLNEGVEAETRATLNRAFAEHHVLVVRPSASIAPLPTRSSPSKAAE
jgi:alpha-ketoglutarate-dependent taurine dioxygenase